MINGLISVNDIKYLREVISEPIVSSIIRIYCLGLYKNECPVESSHQTIADGLNGHKNVSKRKIMANRSKLIMTSDVVNRVVFRGNPCLTRASSETTVFQ